MMTRQDHGEPVTVAGNPHAIILYSQSLRPTEDCIDKRFIRTNDRIRAREIRVIDDEGQQLGIMPPYRSDQKSPRKESWTC